MKGEQFVGAGTITSSAIVGGTPRRQGRGRPIGSRSAREEMRQATCWLGASDYDQLARIALARQQSISSLLRKVLTARFGADE